MTNFNYCPLGQSRKTRGNESKIWGKVQKRHILALKKGKLENVWLQMGQKHILLEAKILDGDQVWFSSWNFPEIPYLKWEFVIFLIQIDMGLKLKIVPDSWEYTGFCKIGPYWPQK
jgi:hypothetical protein